MYIREKGVTLIELMLAISLAFVLALGLSALYISLKNNYNLQQGYARIQESARFLTVFLTQRITMAGLATCQSNGGAPVLASSVWGYDSEHSPDNMQEEIKPGTDAVAIDGCVNNTSKTQDLHLVNMTYFVGDTHRLNSQGEKIYALYQKPSDGDREELVQGVSQLKIQYALRDDTGKNVASYESAQNVNNWSKVVAVNFSLVLDSVEPVIHQPQSYYFQRQLIVPQDHLFYQPWSVYVALREYSGWL